MADLLWLGSVLLSPGEPEPCAPVWIWSILCLNALQLHAACCLLYAPAAPDSSCLLMRSSKDWVMVIWLRGRSITEPVSLGSLRSCSAAVKRQRFIAALLPLLSLFWNSIPGLTTRAPPVGFELATNSIQFYVIAILGKYCLCRHNSLTGLPDFRLAIVLHHHPWHPILNYIT